MTNDQKQKMSQAMHKALQGLYAEMKALGVEEHVKMIVRVETLDPEEKPTEIWADRVYLNSPSMKRLQAAKAEKS